MSLPPPRSIQRTAVQRRRSAVVFPTLAAVVAVGCGDGRSEPAIDPASFILYEVQDQVDEFGHHYFDPMYSAQWRSAAAADHLCPEDNVVGWIADGTPWAIPTFVFDKHHVANFEFKEGPWMIVRCEVCSSASAWVAEIDGQRLTFRVCGLYNGTILLRDFESGSLWTPFTGECIHGPHQGRRLTSRTIDQAGWTDWVELWPETKVAWGPESMRLGHGCSESPGHDYLGHRMNATRQTRDDRVPDHELVIGVRAGNASMAFTLEQLERTGLATAADVGETPVVVLHRKDRLLAAAFLRTLDGEVLQFAERGGRLVDVATGSEWDLAGRCTNGPLAGRVLTRALYSLEEWYMWITQHPRSELYRAP
jgi:Protein of unknown function (DUF3179)